MAEYQKQERIGGDWVKGSEVKSGVKAKLINEVRPVASQFKDEKTGEAKMQDVGKILFQGDKEAKNINLNRATINGLVEAFGTSSADWVNKILTVQTEKMIVGGKRVTAVYLIADGFQLTEDDNGYMTIVKDGMANAEKVLMVDDEDINPADIPF